MSWARFDDRAASNPKVALLSDAAFRLWVSAILHCCEHLTDGRIGREVPGILPRAPQGDNLEAVTAELVRRGLWTPTEDGWEVHDFNDWNPPASEVKEKRELARQRMERVRANKQRTHSERSQPVRAKFAKSSPYPVPVPVPVPEPNGSPPVGPPPPDSRHGTTLPHTASTPEQAPAPKTQKKARQSPIGDWSPDASMAELARSLGLDAALEAEKMRDWALSNNKTKADWNATFRNWLRRAAPDARLPARSGVSHAAPQGGRGGGSLTVAGRVTGAPESLTERAARYARELREDCPDLWGEV